MSETRNVIEHYFGALQAGEYARAFGMMSDDVNYVITGSTKISKSYAGLAGLQSELLPFMGEVFKENIKFTLIDIIVEGDRGVVIATGKADAVHGDYNQQYCFYLTVRDGKIVSKLEMVDSLPVETALLGNKLVRG